MTSSILFAGQEDIDFTIAGVGSIASVTQGTAPVVNVSTWAPITNTTVTSAIRGAYARSGMCWFASNETPITWIRTLQFSTGSAITTSSNFWSTARMYGTTGNQSASGLIPMRWVDSSGVTRLQIKASVGNFPYTILLQTVNAAGTATTLVTSAGTFGSGSPGTPDKIDVFINYAVSGTFTVYCNGSQVVTYSGDLTTNGQTALAFMDLGLITNNNGGSYNVWSEVIVATRDTRNMSLVTQAPITAGNSSAWTSSSLSSTTITGQTNADRTSGRSANDVIFMKFTNYAQGNISAGTITLNAGITATIQMALYSDVASAPGTLLGSSSTSTNPSSGAVTCTFATPVPMASNTVYYLAFRATAAYTVNANGSSLFWVQTGQSVFPSSAASTGPVSNTTPIFSYVLQTPYVGTWSLDSAGPDSSSTVNQLEEYQVYPALPTGNFSVVSVVAHASVTVGSSGPSKFDYAVRTGGSDFLSSPDLAPGVAWSTIPYHWDTNPNTTVAWQTSELVASSTSFNIGYKSIT